MDKNKAKTFLKDQNEGQSNHQNSQDLQLTQFCTEGSSIENVDNFIIGKRIGQGAYAVVRVGLHKLLNQKIAVKIYEKFKLLEPNRRKSVKREIKIMEKLDHECLAKLFEAFESHKQVFLIMEYVNGGSLHGYLKGKPNRQMSEIEAKFLWQQVVFGIHYLHQRNVTHRDIKLENILLDETMTRVKLIDFGFSTCIPHEKKVKIFCGTPSYMAPEIVSKIEYSGPPADIWALGVLLYALLCGKFPFKGQNDKELYSNICKQDLPLPDHISRQAKQLLTKIFQKNPEKRPSTKEILRDSWLVFSSRDQEMMSPKSLALLEYLRKISQINFGSNAIQQNFGNKITLNKTITSGFNKIGNENLEYQAIGNFYLQSKDKRHQLNASDIKNFIIEQNFCKNLNNYKHQIESINSDHGLNRIEGESQKMQFGVQLKQQQQQTKVRNMMNETMPLQGVEGLGNNSQINIKEFTGEIINDNSTISRRAIIVNNNFNNHQDQEIQKKQNNIINMEAYQAYHNTNDNKMSSSDVQQINGTKNSQERYIDDLQNIIKGGNNNYNILQTNKNYQNNYDYRQNQFVESLQKDPENNQNMKIIICEKNNVMHINHSGANIQILCGGQGCTQILNINEKNQSRDHNLTNKNQGNLQNQNEQTNWKKRLNSKQSTVQIDSQQNNFIFNNTAPINLNFYEKNNKQRVKNGPQEIQDDLKNDKKEKQFEKDEIDIQNKENN